MLFHSATFLFVFLPVTLAVFLLALRAGCQRCALAWLVLASIFYYGAADTGSLWVILLSTVVNYLLGRRIARERGTRTGRVLLWLGIAANLGSLAYFKYAGFIVQNLNAVAALGWSGHDLVLPLAISFFTFQKIAYLVDVHQGRAGEYDALEFSLFVLFFPQLIAGPIVHHGEIVPQFRRVARGVDPMLLAGGITMFVAGLAKKVLVADQVADHADRVFAFAEAGGVPNFVDAWGGALAYTFQIYFDFSGYSDMAIGLALLFGVRLPENFASPYRARSVIAFWQRWHITLSRFLRDYLYIPLGGNRRGPWRRHFNLLVTMLLGGLWHGAAWTFVAWGALHGAYLMVNHAWRSLRPRLPLPRFGRAGALLAWALTFSAVVVAWVLFRADSFGGALRMLAGMTGAGGIALPQRLLDTVIAMVPAVAHLGLPVLDGAASLADATDAWWLAALLAGVTLVPNTQQLLASVQPVLVAPGTAGVATVRARRAWHPSTAWGCAVGLLATAAIFSLGRLHEFIYFRF
jgi:alginate O-acetyltransferase complex protein AlgI